MAAKVAAGASPASAYAHHREGFRKFHRGTLNVLLHLALTPMGVAGAAALVARAASPTAMAAVAAVYCASLLAATPLPVALASAACTMAICALCAKLALGYGAAAILILVGYFGQDLAHWVTGEATYQSSYQKSDDFWALLAQHTYYLLPLVLDTAYTTGLASGVLLFLTPRNDVLFHRIESEQGRSALRNLRDWVVAQKPSETCTTHWWALELPSEQKTAFESVAEGPEMSAMFRARFGADQYAVEPLHGMNEVYVASTVHSNNSDTVFFMDHVDGPYMLYPFCYVYRTLVAITENRQIATVFPMQPFRVAISDGEVVGLDFHREVHRIESDPSQPNAERRVTCKMHYVVYPRCLGPIGRHLGTLTVRYNQTFRYLFLNTIAAQTLFWRFMTKMVLIGTEGTFRLEQVFGLNNIVFVGALALAGLLVGSPFFLAATSFLHYAKYVATFYHRGRASFGKFIRDSCFYKLVATSQLLYHYGRHAASAGPASVALVVGGLALSSLALWRLGPKRAYFGAEMGVVAPARVDAFPYGAIPHPMALGWILTLTGAHMAPGFAAALPWLAPAHAVCTALHVAQEVLDLHA